MQEVPFVGQELSVSALQAPSVVFRMCKQQQGARLPRVLCENLIEDKDILNVIRIIYTVIQY